jgi:integrase
MRGEPWQATAIIKVLALSGCRRGEIERLKRSEIDLRRSALRLGDTKTGESIRPLAGAALGVLKQSLLRSNTEYVFPSQKSEGKPFVGLPKIWKRILGGELNNLTPHGLRHAYASTAEDLCLSIPTIKALLGHAISGITEGYIHKIDAALIGAADQVANHISNAMEGCTARSET